MHNQAPFLKIATYSWVQPKTIQNPIWRWYMFAKSHHFSKLFEDVVSVPSNMKSVQISLVEMSMDSRKLLNFSSFAHASCHPKRNHFSLLHEPSNLLLEETLQQRSTAAQTNYKTCRLFPHINCPPKHVDESYDVDIIHASISFQENLALASNSATLTNFDWLPWHGVEASTNIKQSILYAKSRHTCS